MTVVHIKNVEGLSFFKVKGRGRGEGLKKSGSRLLIYDFIFSYSFIYCDYSIDKFHVLFSLRR